MSPVVVCDLCEPVTVTALLVEAGFITESGYDTLMGLRYHVLRDVFWIEQLLDPFELVSRG